MSQRPDRARGAFAPVTIAGSGNWLIGSDRIGQRVLERVADRWGSEVELVDLGATSLALLDHLRGQELLLLVDACVGMGAAGEVRIYEPDLENVSGPSTSIHQIGPVETLAVARELAPDTLPRRLRLVLVETTGLSEVDEEKVCDQVIEVLDREVEGWRRGDLRRLPLEPAAARAPGRMP